MYCKRRRGAARRDSPIPSPVLHRQGTDRDVLPLTLPSCRSHIPLRSFLLLFLQPPKTWTRFFWGQSCSAALPVRAPGISPEGCGSKRGWERRKTSPWVGTRAHRAVPTSPDAEQVCNQIALNTQILLKPCRNHALPKPHGNNPGRGWATHAAASRQGLKTHRAGPRQLTAANTHCDLAAGNSAPYPSFPAAGMNTSPSPSPACALRSLKVLFEPGGDLSGSTEFHLGFALPRNKVKFRNKSKATVFALAGCQHGQHCSTPSWNCFIPCSQSRAGLEQGCGEALVLPSCWHWW